MVIATSFTWRCRFCRTLLAIARTAIGTVIICPQCKQQTAIAAETIAPRPEVAA